MNKDNKNNKGNPFSKPLNLKESLTDSEKNPKSNKKLFKLKKLSSFFSGWIGKAAMVLAGLVVLFGIYLLFFYQAPVEIKVEPSNATIKLDKKEVGQSFSARPGKHQLEINANGYLTYEKEIEVNYFSNQPIEVSLQKSPEFVLLDKSRNLDRGKISFLDHNEENNTLFYLKDEACWRLNMNHDNPKPEQISPSIFKNVSKLIWSEDNLGAIVQVYNPQKLKGTKFYKNTVQTATWFYDFKRYDLLNQVAHDWGTGIGSIGLAPSKEQVGHFFSTLTPETSLVISNLRRSDVKRVARINGFEDPYISWQPNPRYILIVKNSEIIAFDTYLDTLKDISKGSFEVAQVTPNSKNIIYLSPSHTPDKPASIMSINGEDKKNLNFNFRLSNTDWVQDNKFCGIGSKDNKSLAFCYNINTGLEEMAWPKINSTQISETKVDLDNKKFYLIKNDQLVSLKAITKDY